MDDPDTIDDDNFSLTDDDDDDEDEDGSLILGRTPASYNY